MTGDTATPPHQSHGDGDGGVRERNCFGSCLGMLDFLVPWQEQENSNFQLCAVSSDHCQSF